MKLIKLNSELLYYNLHICTFITICKHKEYHVNFIGGKFFLLSVILSSLFCMEREYVNDISELSRFLNYCSKDLMKEYILR